MKDFQRKVRIRDLKLKSLIKFRLSQNRSQSSSRSRCADAHLPSFSAGVLAHCRRCGALSEGGFPPGRSCVAHEIKFDHWPIKLYFRRFSARLHRKLWPGFPICSLEKMFHASGPSYTCSVTWSHRHFGAISSLRLLHGRLAGIAKAAGMLLVF